MVVNTDVSSIDERIGQSVKVYRLSRGLSLRDLASSVGVTPQQLHKYEHGRNRICAGRLYALASVLLVPVHLFFPSDTVEGHESAYEENFSSGYVLQENSSPYISAPWFPDEDAERRVKKQKDKEEVILSLAMELDQERLVKVVRVLSSLVKEDGKKGKI